MYSWLQVEVFIDICIYTGSYTHLFPCSVNWEDLKATSILSACILVSNTILQKKRTRDPWRNGAYSQIGAENTQDAAGTLVMPENKKMFKKAQYVKCISMSPYHTYIDKGFSR